ncbi:ATP-binding protein [Massilia aquatica]|uniref:histidine kinase n=1 Tax=Massilia aquatica TaxID=2609000 RepID=A0ABX0MJU9_9BURK|nr:ATP-binding protein [Massilia aquatica]NHZ44685.1 response regulator [Massilia aquatica]
MSYANRRILLIDDMPSIHEDFRKILAARPVLSELDAMEAQLFGSSSMPAAGFVLDSAYQGEEGVALARRACADGLPYGLAFVDMRMPPGIDGAETIARLWQHDPQLQVVLCTAYSDHAWDTLLARLDVRDRLLILKKPFDAIEVVQLAAMLTAKWSATQAAACELRRLDEAVRERTAALDREVAARAQLEGRLAQAEKLASIGRLAAGVAHEINNPLGFLSSNLQTLERYVGALLARSEGAPGAADGAELGYMKDDLPALMAESRAGLARVARIVKGLRDFSPEETGQEWTRADVRVCLEATLTVLGARIGQAIAVERSYGVLPDIDCRPAQLNQVFMSLLSNALDAIGAVAGTLAIRAGSADGQVWIEVEDSGCGIGAQHLPLIFDPFFTTKRIGQGMGLGLSQVYGIVQAHQGSIAASSGEGRGAMVRVVLPVRQAAPLRA